MNAKRNLHRVLVVSGVLSTLVLGCELIVDFDRTKIPVEANEAAPEAAPIDAPIDTNQPDATADSADAADASDAADATDAADAADAADGD